MVAPAASQLLDDGSGIACVAAPCIRHHRAATNIIVLAVRST
jgi:hypothetical protein